MTEPVLPDAPEVELFDGEALDFDEVELVDAQLTDAELEEKYVTGEVRIVTEQARYPLPSIPGLVASDDYEINPEFQRRHRWSAEKQSRLIESFIMNVPVPPIFLYEDRYSHFEVMDGLQRLTAITTFYNNELVLEGLTVWPELNQRRYRDLPEQVRRGVDRRYLSSIILLKETAKTNEDAQQLKQLVFERLNSGGVRLEAQESRNAIYDGPLNRLCIELSRNSNLCRTWDIPPPTEDELSGAGVDPALEKNRAYSNMSDVELVLRFFAHRQRRRVGGGALRTYLDTYLRQGNSFPPEVLGNLESLFVRTIRLVDQCLGPEAFWLWRFRHGQWGWLERPSTAAYDAIMFAFSLHLDRADELMACSSELQSGLRQMYEQNADKFDARMTNMRNLRERDALVNELVESVVTG